MLFVLFYTSIVTGTDNHTILLVLKFLEITKAYPQSDTVFNRVMLPRVQNHSILDPTLLLARDKHIRKTKQ